MKIFRQIACLLCLLLPAAAIADDITFTGQARPSTVTVGNRIEVSYTLTNAKSTEIREGECDGLDRIYGPSFAQQSSTQILNGQVTTSTSVRFTYIYVARKAGEFTISPATVIVDGKKYTSNALTVRVVDAGTGTEQTPNNQSAASGGTTLPKGEAPDIMVRQSLNKSNVYEGEAVVLTTKIYTRVNLDRLSAAVPPALSEFVSQELFEGQLMFDREAVEGVVYNSAISSQMVLLPQKTGKIKIDPMEYEFVVKQRVRGSGGGFFGGFFDDVQLVRQRVKSNTLTINVKPLPAGKPAGFSGGVGDFTFKAIVSPTELEVDNSLQLRATVSGEGNLKLLSLPKPTFHPDFDSFDPNESQKLSNTFGGTKGSRTAEYLVIPRVAGEFEIPEMTFSFFNPKTEKYVTLRQGPFTINVAKGEGTSGNQGVVVSAGNGSAVVYTGRDLRYIRTQDTSLSRKAEFFVLSPLFWGLCGGAVLAFAAISLFYINKRKNSREIDRVKMRRANKAARKRLKVAARLIKEEKREAFFDEVMRALWGYLSDKLTLPLSELTKDNAKEEMLRHQIDEATANEFMHLLDNCEFARYAPANQAGSMNDIYSQAIEMIGKIDDLIR